MPFKITINSNTYTEIELKTLSNSKDPALSVCYKWFNKIPIEVKTSGSTGKPKVVTLNREMINISAVKTLQFFSLKENSTSLLCINPNYIGGIMMILRSIIGKLNLVIEPPTSDPLKNTGKFDIEFAAMVPIQLNSSISNRRKLPRKLIIGGAPIQYELNENVKSIKGCDMYATYGMTETYSHIALRRLNQPGSSEYFLPLPGINIKKNKEDNTLQIKGDITHNQWLSTNDICEIQNGEQFKILGRTDNVINSGGIKINPEVIERKIANILKGINYFIAGIPDEKLGERIILIIEGKNLKDNENIYIKSFKKVLDKFEIPKQIEVLENFEYTETQKIRRSQTLEKLITQDQN